MSDEDRDKFEESLDKDAAAARKKRRAEIEKNAAIAPFLASLTDEEKS